MHLRIEKPSNAIYYVANSITRNDLTRTLD